MRETVSRWYIQEKLKTLPLYKVKKIRFKNSEILILLLLVFTFQVFIFLKVNTLKFTFE
jgi:hypothetical protein